MSKMDRHKETFKEEAYEILSELETSLLELEDRPDDLDIIGRVFRAMHTIKGSGAMFGFHAIADFTHELETVYDMVRNGKMAVTKELINLTLSARDRIYAMLDAFGSDEPVDETGTKEIIASLRRLIPENTPYEGKTPACPAAPDSDKGTSLPDNSGKDIIYRIRFRPPADIFLKGINPVYLLDELRQLGDCKVIAHTEAIPYLDDIDPELCYTSWDVLLTTNKGINAIRDVFIFIEGESELKIDVIDVEGNTDNETDYKRLGEILIERGDLTEEDLKKALMKKKRVGEIMVEEGMVSPDHVCSALVEQKHVRDERGKRIEKDSISSIRVPSYKLDRLVDLVGEMVTVKARLGQAAVLLNNSNLLSIAEEVARLTEELRDNTMNIRMLPIGTTFNKFRRLVRDLSNELGKEVELTTEGGETELDKTVIEKLNDPLVHLIRNSIDHGIEMPEIRVNMGKPGKGTIRLSSLHSGTNVLIRIRDDGAGLDAERIRAKAVEKGLITADSELPERELYNLILAPGFSTARTVTSVSGRGVGMDVVRQAMDALGGSIDISSRKGIGTTITLKVPLTLAIIEGLLVKIAEDYFVLPLSVVKECVELTREDVAGAHGGNLANVRGQVVPYIRLRERFGMDGKPPAIEQIVITELDGNRIGLAVDHVIGEHQTVIKSLGKFYRGIEEVSGATILGDGTVALILDVSKLIQSVEKEEGAWV